MKPIVRCYIIVAFIIFLLLYVYLSSSLFTNETRDIEEWRHGDLVDPKKFAFLLEKYGIVIIPDVVTPNEIDRILQHAHECNSKQYGDINEPKHRKDQNLLLDSMEFDLRTVYNKNPYFWETVFPDYIIAECSMLTSYPGSNNQPWHADTTYKKNRGNLVSVGIALDDITYSMGPLEVFPGSNTYAEYVDNDNTYDTLDVLNEVIPCESFITYLRYRLLGLHPEKCNCSKGSLVFWNSNVIHRGSANQSRKKRPVFYFSLLESGKKRPKGSTYSLCKEDKGKNIPFSKI